MTAAEDEARREMDEEYAELRERLGPVFVAFDSVRSAGPEDDVTGLLETLEDEVKKLRTGGWFGSGSKGHRKARERWMELRGLDG